MKKLVIVGLFVGSLVCSKAQTLSTTPPPTLTGGLQQIADAAGSATNWAALAGYGQGINNGAKKLYFADLSYNFTPLVGLVIGGDELSAHDQVSQQNVVKGGVTLSMPSHIFAFLGSTFMTNVVTTPFVADLLATPTSGNTVGNIVDTGMSIKLFDISNFKVEFEGHYENRSGEGFYSGNYWGVSLALRRAF